MREEKFLLHFWSRDHFNKVGWPQREQLNVAPTLRVESVQHATALDLCTLYAWCGECRTGCGTRLVHALLAVRLCLGQVKKL